MGDSNLQEKFYNLYKKAKSNTEWLRDSLIDFIVFQKERVIRGKITESTIPNYYKPVKLFCDMYDIIINWKLVTRDMPCGYHAANDRTPTMDEIIQLLKYPDIHITSFLLTMIFCGIRIDAWDYLQWKHIVPITGSNYIIMAAKVIVYAGEPWQKIDPIVKNIIIIFLGIMYFRFIYLNKILS